MDDGVFIALPLISVAVLVLVAGLLELLFRDGDR